MQSLTALRVDHHHHFIVQYSEAYLARLAVIFALVLTGYGEVVPNDVAAGEVQSVILYVQLSLGFDRLIRRRR